MKWNNLQLPFGIKARKTLPDLTPASLQGTNCPLPVAISDHVQDRRFPHSLESSLCALASCSPTMLYSNCFQDSLPRLNLLTGECLVLLCASSTCCHVRVQSTFVETKGPQIPRGALEAEQSSRSYREEGKLRSNSASFPNGLICLFLLFCIPIIRNDGSSWFCSFSVPGVHSGVHYFM